MEPAAARARPARAPPGAPSAHIRSRSDPIGIAHVQTEYRLFNRRVSGPRDAIGEMRGAPCHLTVPHHRVRAARAEPQPTLGGASAPAAASARVPPRARPLSHERAPARARRKVGLKAGRLAALLAGGLRGAEHSAHAEEQMQRDRAWRRFREGSGKVQGRFREEQMLRDRAWRRLRAQLEAVRAQ